MSNCKKNYNENKFSRLNKESALTHTDKSSYGPLLLFLGLFDNKYKWDVITFVWTPGFNPLIIYADTIKRGVGINSKQ
jgi:hypothetical protein